MIGLSGGQGSGKSTISKIIKIVLKEIFNLETVIFSIDDFYKTLNQRKKMSLKVNPLFITRGVPGTHDTKLLFNCIKNLKNKKFRKIKIPRFDKSIDDRLPKQKWQKIDKKPDIIIFEGWCVEQNLKKKHLSRPIIIKKEEDKKKIGDMVIEHSKMNIKKFLN